MKLRTPSRRSLGFFPGTHPSSSTVFSRFLRRIGLLLAVVAGLAVEPLQAQTIYILTEDGCLATAPVSNPSAASVPAVLTGVNVTDTLVAIDVRPQNQQLYALGVNVAAGTMQLYHISPERFFAVPVGNSGTLVNAGGTPVSLGTASTRWDMDFNPAVDRIRVVTSDGLNFRMNPNTGALVDGDLGGAAGSVLGVNPDGPINGGTTTLSAIAYTNNQPNNGNVTTLYAVDAASNSLFIQNPPNSGTQTLGNTITVNGSALEFSQATLDIDSGINTDVTNAGVTSGNGIFVAKAGNFTTVYALNLATAQAKPLGTLNLSVRGTAIRTEVSAALALSIAGPTLERFDPIAPGTTTSVNVMGVAAGEILVGVASRPQTGQLYGLGVNATANTATLYLLDPQNGSATAVGTAGQIAFVTAAATPVDFPDPATVGYGLGFNPAVDRIRVTTGSGLNFRVNPITGAPVDGDIGGAAGTVSGVNTDGLLNGAGTGAEGVAYTNNFAQSPMTGVTTLYTLNATNNTLCIQNPANSGTQTLPVTVTLNGATLDFGIETGFDIPSPVSVGVSNTPAKGAGWMVSRVTPSVGSPFTGVFRVDLTTGVAQSFGALGSGTAAGAVVWSAYVPLANDTVVAIGGATRINPLANDDLLPGSFITSVSDPTIQIEGRTLVIPAGFTGAFTYGVSDGATTGHAFVSVTAGTAGMNPTSFNGLILDADKNIVGWANAAITTKGVATVQFRGGSQTVTAKVTFPTGITTASTFTKLGNLSLDRLPNGTVTFTLAALGGDLTGTLRAALTTTTAQKHHIALASVDAAIPGGGYAIATTTKKGAIAIKGLLPDGLPFSAATTLADNGSIAFFSVVTKGPKPPALVGGELVVANLTATDVTGELLWSKLAQATGVKGLHLSGVDTVLTANGSLYAGIIPFTGAGILTLSGGDLAATESGATTVSAKGIPTVPSGSLKGWTGVVASLGKFTAKVQVPGIVKPVTGSGIYLPKSKTAWGFFPGKTVGGRIELNVP